MTHIDPSASLASLAIQRPQRTRIFEQLGLDYCCGGERSLREQCEARGLDLTTVVTLLEGELRTPAAETRDWSSAPIDDLVDHIVDDHHAYLRRELPRISHLTGKVVAAHAGEAPELRELERVVDGLRADLEEHLEVEERVTFPAARAVAAGDPGAQLGDLEALEHEHEEVGAALADLRRLTNGFDSEQALCGTHRALVDGLRELELDIHEHVHEENNILFPRLLTGTERR